MSEISMAKNNPYVHFAQIYGMCNHLSFGLGDFFLHKYFEYQLFIIDHSKKRFQRL